MGAEKGG